MEYLGKDKLANIRQALDKIGAVMQPGVLAEAIGSATIKPTPTPIITPKSTPTTDYTNTEAYANARKAGYNHNDASYYAYTVAYYAYVNDYLNAYYQAYYAYVNDSLNAFVNAYNKASAGSMTPPVAVEKIAPKPAPVETPKDKQKEKEVEIDWEKAYQDYLLALKKDPEKLRQAQKALLEAAEKEIDRVYSGGTLVQKTKTGLPASHMGDWQTAGWGMTYDAALAVIGYLNRDTSSHYVPVKHEVAIEFIKPEIIPPPPIELEDD